MAEIRPFKGVRYNPQKIRLEEIISEPYDRISPSLQETYYNRNLYNIVRIILGKDDDPESPEKDKYRRAKIYLDEWLRKGILIKEDEEAFYLYEQEFRVGGDFKRRLGLITRVKLEEFSSRRVLPHEKTFPKHKADRLKLLQATNTNTGQIFLLYKDEDMSISHKIRAARNKAVMGAEVKDEDGFLHKLWIIKDKNDIQRIQESMVDKVLIIADGHHRYETSLNYRKYMCEKIDKVKGNESFFYIMMTLFRIDDPGLVILPTYRLVKGLDNLSEENLRRVLSSNFEIDEVGWADTSDNSVLNMVRNRVMSENHVFAAYVSSLKKFYIFRLRSEELLEREIREERSEQWKRLDVAILHSLIIDKLEALASPSFSLESNVSYIRNLDEGINKVKDGEFQMIFLLRPVSLNQIGEIVENGELMPQKSTDFFPKLKSGLVMNPLDD